MRAAVHDPLRAPTRLQLRVLRVLRAIGPCSVTELRMQFLARGPALRAALHWLRLGGWAYQPAPKRWDVTAAGRQWCQVHSAPEARRA